MIKKITLLLFSFGVLLNSCTDNSNENSISESGTIELKEVTLSAQIPANLKYVFKTEGEHVNQGDTLAALDNEKLLLQLEQAKANLQISQARFDLLTNGARKEDVKSATESFNQARYNRALAKTNLERMKNLLESNSITQKQFDDVQTSFKMAESKVKQAKANLYKIKNIARPEELSQAIAGISLAEANVSLVQKNIDDAILISPFNGVVTEYYFEKGEFVPAFGSVLSVTNYEQAEVKVYVSELDLGKVNLGQSANITVDSFPGEVFEGKVVKIASNSEFTPKNIQTKEERTKLVYEVTVDVPNPDFKLKNGMPADIEIEL